MEKLFTALALATTSVFSAMTNDALFVRAKTNVEIEKHLDAQAALDDGQFTMSLYGLRIDELYQR